MKLNESAWMSEIVMPGITRADVLAIAKRIKDDPDTASDEDCEILQNYADKFKTEITKQ